MDGKKSKIWFACSALCFVCVAIIALVAKTYKPPVQDNSDFISVFPVTGVLRGNPAPSVKLEVTSSPFCLPCRQLKPILARLKELGYNITIIETSSPQGPVPKLQFSQFDKVKQVEFGYKTEEQIKEIFEKIEGSVFRLNVLPVFRWLENER